MRHIPYYGQAECKPVKPTPSVNKNGYEIRTEILAIAKDYIEKQAKANAEYAEKLYSLGTLGTDEYLLLIKPYTIESILERADDMYKFISKK